MHGGTRNNEAAAQSRKWTFGGWECGCDVWSWWVSRPGRVVWVAGDCCWVARPGEGEALRGMRILSSSFAPSHLISSSLPPSLAPSLAPSLPRSLAPSLPRWLPPSLPPSLPRSLPRSGSVPLSPGEYQWSRSLPPSIRPSLPFSLRLSLLPPPSLSPFLTPSSLSRALPHPAHRAMCAAAGPRPHPLCRAGPRPRLALIPAHRACRGNVEAMVGIAGTGRVLCLVKEVPPSPVAPDTPCWVSGAMLRRSLGPSNGPSR